jgi:L-asparagine oxygenase
MVSTTIVPVASDQFLNWAWSHAMTLDLGEAIDELRCGIDAPFRHLHGLPIGDVPATPLVAGLTDKHDRASEATLLGVAQMLGEPVGYAQEHGGDIVQDLFPLASSVGRQLSTSSGVELAFHTETAFHPHRPHFLLLLCLRGDANAATTLCSVDAIVRELDEQTRAVLQQPRFRCGVDESFGGGSAWVAPAHAVVSLTTNGTYTLLFDGELTFGIDREADAAIAHVNEAIARARTSVTLAAGDLLVVDNHRAVHGRSPFTARFDGTDRWLQRTFVVDDLAPSVMERRGRVITTDFVESAR